MFHCLVGVWVIEQHAIILSATVRPPTLLVTTAIQLKLMSHSTLTSGIASMSAVN